MFCFEVRRDVNFMLIFDKKFNFFIFQCLAIKSVQVVNHILHSSVGQKYIRSDFHKILSAIGVKSGEYTVKSMRTSFGTRCNELGIDKKIRSLWMGHANENTTDKYYTHIQKDFEQKEAQKFTFGFDPKIDPKN